MSHPSYDHISDYIAGTRIAVLTYLREGVTPVARSMGSFAPEGLDLFFSTRREAAKVGEIGRKPRVSFFFEQAKQKPESWKNVLLIGDAHEVTESAELATAVASLSARNPRFRDRIAQGELASITIFRIRTREIEYLDWSRGFGYVEKIVL